MGILLSNQTLNKDLSVSASFQSELLIKLISLHAKIQRQTAGSLSCHGISLTEYLVLRRLYQAENHKARRIDLAEQVGLSASGITRLLNPMQKIGLVVKEEVARDARVSLVALTSAGEKIFNDASSSFNAVAESIFGKVAADDQAELFRFLNILL